MPGRTVRAVQHIIYNSRKKKLSLEGMFGWMYVSDESFFILKEFLLVFLGKNMYIYAEQRKNRREECIYEEKKQKSGLDIAFRFSSDRDCRMSEAGRDSDRCDRDRERTDYNSR